MVNFNNETTVTRPRQDVVNFIILQRRQDCLDKLREYTQSILQRSDEDAYKLAEFKSYFFTLAMEVVDMIEKESPKATDPISGNIIYHNADEFLNVIMEGTEKEVMIAFRFLSKLLYVKGLIKSDIKDLSDPEEELYSDEEDD